MAIFARDIEHRVAEIGAGLDEVGAMRQEAIDKREQMLICVKSEIGFR